jgi:hypothetical protein
MSVRITSVVHCRVIHSIKTGDQRRRDTGPSKHEPRRPIPTATRTKHSNSCIGIRNCGNVSNRPSRTADILLPGRLGIDRAAPTAGTDSHQRSYPGRRQIRSHILPRSLCPPLATDCVGLPTLCVPPAMPRPRHQGTPSGAERLTPSKHWMLEGHMGFGRGVLLWLLGVPIPIILLLAMCSHH